MASKIPPRWCLLSVVALSLGLGAVAAGEARAQERFVGDENVYSVAVPLGWTKFETNDADAAFAAPGGGTSRGTIFFGASDSYGSLDEEAEQVADGGEMKDFENLDVRGMPCVYFWTDDGFARSNALICQFHVPTPNGPALTTFTLGSSSRPEDWPAHTRVLRGMIGSLSWRDDVFP